MTMKHHPIKIIILSAFFAVCCGAPSFAQQLLTRDNEKIDFAHGLLQQSMFSLAAAQYEEFIQQFPQSQFLDDAYLGVAESHFFLKEYERAVALYQKYIEQFPSGKSKAVALVRSGQCFYLLGKHAEALAQFTAVDPTGLTPTFLQTLNFYMGQIHAIQKKYKEAALFYEKAVVLPDGAYTAQAYLQWAGALSGSEDYIGALEKAAKALELAKTDEFKVSAMMKQAEIYFLSGQYAQAAEAFKKVADLYPSLPIVPDATANWFTALLSNKQYDEIVAQYDQRFKDNLQNSYVPVHLTAAKAFGALGKNDEAVAVLTKVENMSGITDGQRAKTHLNKIDLLVRSGRFRDALDSVNAEIAINPAIKIPIILLKSQSYLGLKNYEAAWGHYQEVLKESPDTSFADEAVCGLGHIRYGQSQYEEAAKFFMDCSQKSKDEGQRSKALYHAFLAYEKTNVDKAIEIGESYIQTFPKGESLLDVGIILAGLYSKKENYQKSVDLLKPLVNDSDDTRRQNAIFQIAYNLHMAGEKDEALLGYERVINEHKTADQAYYLALKNSFIIYLQNKNETKAADVLERAIREFENNDIPSKHYLWLAQYWQDRNEPGAMLTVLGAAQKVHGASPDALGIKFFTAEAHRMQNNCPEAVKSYDETIAQDNDGKYKARSYLGKGACLITTGDFAGAQTELSRAIGENPDDQFVALRGRFELARAAEAEKKLEEAAKLYLVVSVLYNDPYYSPEALLRAAGIFQQLNNKTEALNALKQILSAYPQSPQAVKAKEIADTLK